MKTVHRGPWADSVDAAVSAALAEVNVDVGEWTLLAYSDGYAAISPSDEWRIDIEVKYSEVRDQYQSILRRSAYSAVT